MRTKRVAHKFSLMLSGTCLSFLLCTPVLAAVESGTFGGARLGLFKPDADRFITRQDESFAYRDSFENLTYGLQLGHLFDNQWQLRTYYDRVNLNVRGEQQYEARGHSYGADVMYQWRNGLYAGLGINQTRANRQQDSGPRGSLGYRLELKDRFFTSLEYNIQRHGDFNDQQLHWSLNYRFGRNPAQQMMPREFIERRQQRRLQAVKQTTQTSQINLTARYQQQSSHPTSQQIAQQPAQEPSPQPPQPLALFFEFDSARLTPSSQQQLQHVAEHIQRYADHAALLIGHSDLTGSDRYNLNLSRQRAEHVARVLTQEFAVDAKRLRIFAAGSAQPLYPEVNKQANARNRRVEIRFQQPSA